MMWTEYTDTRIYWLFVGSQVIGCFDVDGYIFEMVTCV